MTLQKYESRNDYIQRALLLLGLPIKEVAKNAGLSLKHTYDIAQKLKLPYNRPVKEGGGLEHRILHMMRSGFDNDMIASAFKQAPVVIQALRDKCNETG